METVITFPQLLSARAKLSKPVGLVPTMGYLHEGHLSLVRAARAESASVVATIFVNPAQFGPTEDLAAYPRDLARDLELLEREGANLVWMPSNESMYPPGFQTWVNVEKITQTLEGAMRPGHFRGVATVITKLFNAIQPDKAYFGQKDAQQAEVIRRLSADLNFPLQVVICPTVRETDGLAMSSRNSYLNPAERSAATVLYRALSAARDVYEKGERQARALREVMLAVLNREPLAQAQYVSCATPDTLEELDGLIIDRALLSMAVFIGRTRLIDNLVLGDEQYAAGY